LESQFLKVFGVTVTVEGTDSIVPGSTYIYASNHASMFDIPAVLAGLPDDIVERISRQVEADRDEILGFLSQLVGFRTPSQDPEDVYFPTEIQTCHAFLGDTLGGMGFDLETWLARPMSFPRWIKKSVTLAPKRT